KLSGLGGGIIPVIEPLVFLLDEQLHRANELRVRINWIIVAVRAFDTVPFHDNRFGAVDPGRDVNPASVNGPDAPERAPLAVCGALRILVAQREHRQPWGQSGVSRDRRDAFAGQTSDGYRKEMVERQTTPGANAALDVTFHVAPVNLIVRHFTTPINRAGKVARPVTGE